jgi:hypothetical protein
MRGAKLAWCGCGVPESEKREVEKGLQERDRQAGGDRVPERGNI